MTIHHIFYIPTIFLLGFIFGTMVNERPRAEINSGANNNYKTSLKRLLQTFLVFILVFVITHVFEVPGGVKAVSRLLGGMELFDKSPVFSSTEVYDRVRLIPSEGLHAYKRFTYTIDVLFPVSFLAFLLTFARFASQRSTLSKSSANVLIGLPFAWFAADLAENTAIFSILSKFPSESYFLGSSLGLITALKFALLLLSIFTPSLLIIFARKRNVQKSGI